MKYLMILAAIMLMVGCGGGGFSGEWVNGEVSINITEVNPMKAVVDWGEGAKTVVETDRGVADDATYDWVVLEGNGLSFGVTMPRETFNYIELALFDSDGISDIIMFTRP